MSAVAPIDTRTGLLARRCAGLLVAALGGLAPLTLHAAPAANAAAPTGTAPPLVLGQSLPLSGAGFAVANRIQAGTQALVGRLNAEGGVQGRPVQLVTLDDGGDPRRSAGNARQLVQQHGALALLNCLGERACLAMAPVATELGVALVGPFAGTQALRQPGQTVFSLRPDDTREAQALLRQLQAMAVQRLSLLADGSEPARQQALTAVLRGAGLQITALPTLTDSMEPGELAAQLQREPPQALVVNLGPQALERLDAARFGQQPGLPALVITLSTAGLTQVTRVFREQMVGFISVVPNPETSQLPLARELERDADAFVGPEALSFEGMAAYLHLRVVAEALRRAGRTPTPTQLIQALEALGSWSAGGWPLRFSREQHHGSEQVEIGLRARDGRLRR